MSPHEKQRLDPGLTKGFSEETAQILERMDEGFYAIDCEWTFTYVNHHAELFWSRDRKDLIGRSMLDIFPKFSGSESNRTHQGAMESGRHARVETYSTATGAPVQLSIYPSAFGLTVFFYDITGRRKLEEELFDRNELLTLAERSAGIGVWDIDLKTQTLRGTPQFFHLYGLEPTVDPISMEVTRSRRHPEDRDRVARGFKDAMAAGSADYEVEYRILRPNGELRWIFGRGRVVRDGSATPIQFSGIDIDITERKRHEDQIRIVMRELLHRTNNMLAVIQAMFNQTARTSDDLREFEETFGARLRGLASSNEVLVRQDWSGGPIDELIRAQLAPFIGSVALQIELDGPPVVLGPQAVQNIGLALHELATNASKHGALSVPGGKVRITWQFVDNKGTNDVLLQWRELAGPPVKRPERRGFGRFVIETMVARALATDVFIDFAPDGLVWTVTIPESYIVRLGGTAESLRVGEP